MRKLLPFLLLAACSTPATSEDPVVGLIDGVPVQRKAFVDALLLEQGEAFFVRYAERVLVEKAAAEAGIKVEEAQAARAVDAEIEEQIGSRFGGSREQLDTHLARYGQTYERWRASRIQDKHVQLLAEGVLKGKVDPARVQALFEQRYGKDGVRQQIRHLLISTQPAVTRFYPMSEYEAEHEVIQKEARDRAFALHQKLVAGADFAQVATEASDDRSAADGGLLGTGWAGRYGPRFDEAVRTLAVGQLSPVIESREGFHILRVDGFRKGARYEGRALLITARKRAEGDPATEDARFAAALERANGLRTRILGGEEFAAVARVESADRLTGAKGGDMGPFGPGRLGPEVDPVLETLPLNTLSTPVRTRDGYVLVELSNREFIPAQDKKLVRHIRISTEYPETKLRRLTGTLEGLARAKAEKLLAELQAGADFGALARDQSEDELSRRTEGALSGVRVEQLGEAVQKALESMKEGEVRLVQSDRGFHLLKLEGQTQADFSAVKPELELELRRAPVGEKEARDWIAHLRESAKLEPKF